jgi:hypothetical protein
MTQKGLSKTMSRKLLQAKLPGGIVQSLVAVLCALLLAPGDAIVFPRQVSQQVSSPGQESPNIPNDQIDSLVAPIALYPDPLLSQVLVASTYPLEIIQLQQWLQKNGTLNGADLTNAVEKQDWDPSIQAMSVFPDLVKRMGDNIKWTTDLGNAFLAQQSDVMDAVQRMRTKAKDAGQLKSNEQQTVEVKTVESKTVIVVEPTNPQVVYVPTYNPMVVYGPPIYPYPPIYYPPPGYYAAGVAVAFGVGIAVGAAYRGGWGWGCGWGRNNVNININNNYISHYNRTNINNVNRNNINNMNKNASTAWQHNPQHRGGTPYSNKATANKYGGTARGESMSTRQANARQQQGLNSRQQPVASGFRSGGNLNAPATNRVTPNAGGGGGNMGANRGAGNYIGNRQIPSNSPSRNTNAFGGASSRSSAQASSARGASSMGSFRSGGTSSAGGGRRR